MIHRGALLFEGECQALREAVRRIPSPPSPLPPPLRRLRSEDDGSAIAFAGADAWSASGLSELSVPLGLEDAFIALATQRTTPE